jgi:hypothetical protein
MNNNSFQIFISTILMFFGVFEKAKLQILATSQSQIANILKNILLKVE